MDIREAVVHLVEGRDLMETDADSLMEQIMTGQASDAQIGGILIALRLKGETVEEVTGFARAMRRNAISVRTQRHPLVDTCGTGGDGLATFNISTTAAFVVAGAGLAVAKHGNRSVSSKCGSADVLEALGVRLELQPEEAGASIDAVGIGFLFAPLLHPAMKHAIGPRREMGVRTVFNILGPLTNPAGAHMQVLGVYDRSLVEMMARVLASLGTEAALIVHGTDGLDELSTTAPNLVARLKDGQINMFTLDPLDLGLPRARLTDLEGGNAKQNATILRAILEGERGPRRDVVLLNAAAALVAGGLAAGFQEGLSMAESSINSGAASACLGALIDYTNRAGA
jgi:anthranilate phosphoribosyltransferase